MHSVEVLRQEFESRLTSISFSNNPPDLYDPIQYMLDMGGKRIRPVLLLSACEMFGGDYKSAMPAALAIEMFHNFTLVHDDIMDEAPLRRGKETVYQRWNTSIAILAGDTMLSLAYDLLIQLENIPLKSALELFNQTSIEVCEGQQYDMNFETAAEVSIAEYLEMIRLKTAVLLGASLKMGALIGGGSTDDLEKIYRFGESIGLAFQLKDDFLDIYGDTELFGKQTGGDIVSNKKTFMYLKALEKAKEPDKTELRRLYSETRLDDSKKIDTVKGIFERLQIKDETMTMIRHYHTEAIDLLDNVNVSEESKSVLRSIADQIIDREH